MMRTRQIHGGFAAVAAIFLVVILAALGAFMLTLSNTQQLTSAQDVRGTRAYWAARAGLEWGIAKHLAATTCSAATSTLVIEGFTVTVTCTMATYADSGITPGVPPRIFQFTAKAVSAGMVASIGFTERSVSSSLEL